MKAKMSYKSKKIAIITAIILVLISGISIGAYFFIKGNDESSAIEETNNTIQIGNNIEENKPNENNSNIAENNTLENAENNDNTNGIANNANSVENGNTNESQNNSNNNTNNQLPEEEYTQIDYVETGRQILVSEELSVGWSKFDLNNANISTDIEVNRPELEFNKVSKINSISEKDNAVQVGSKITYEITVKNNSKFDYVLSHTCPINYIPQHLFLSFIDQSTVDKSMERYLQEIYELLDKDYLKKWMYAHYHSDEILPDKFHILFNDIIMLPQLEQI